MKICITSCGKDLDSKIEARFGRSQYFIIWDTEQNQHTVLDNVNINDMGGVGIKSAQLMVDQKIQAVITGQVGPKAMQILNSANIKIICDTNGTIKDAIEKYKSFEKNNSQLNLKTGDDFAELFLSQSQNWFGKACRSFRKMRRGKRIMHGKGLMIKQIKCESIR